MNAVSNTRASVHIGPFIGDVTAGWNGNIEQVVVKVGGGADVSVHVDPASARQLARALGAAADTADGLTRDVVQLDVRLRLDPNEPNTAGACAVTEAPDGWPLIVVSDLQRVDELRLGHLVAMLLVNAEHDQHEGDA